MVELPDILVCGAGGTLGEAWMRGLLHGIEDGSELDFRECRHLLATSAGSIIAAVLAAGRRPQAGDAAARDWAEAAPDAAPVPGALEWLGELVAPAAPLALAAAAPAGALVRRAALAAAPRGERRMDRVGALVEGLDARFDGRLLVAAVDRQSGRRVLFGAPGAPPASVREAVLASCAIPAVFAPVRIGDREYVDGGVWSPTNLDAAPVRRGARVLVLAPTAAASVAALRAVTNAALRAETLAVRGRGAHVQAILPDRASTEAIGPNLMDSGPRPQVLAAGYAQGRRLGESRTALA